MSTLRPPNATVLGRALGLGALAGARASAPWVGFGIRGVIASPRWRAVALAAGLGEACGDQLPSAPPRSAPPALAGRVVSGALSGRHCAGSMGAVAAATAAAASATLTQRLRAAVVAHGGLSDHLYGALEDVVVFAAAALLAGPGEASEGSDALR